MPLSCVIDMRESPRSDMDGGSLDTLAALEQSLSTDDLFSQITQDLEMPVLSEVDEFVARENIFCEELYRDLSDGSDSGLDCPSLSSVTSDLKMEPPSPLLSQPLSPCTSHCSDESLDSILSQPLLDPLTALPMEVKLETPPVTPPRDVVMNFTGVTPAPVSRKNSLNLTQFSGGHVVTRVTSQPGSKHIEDVMKQKVKIQPKPIASPTSTAPVKPVTKGPLVLTAEEFARLTSQGMLKLSAPAERQTKVAAAPIHKTARVAKPAPQTTVQPITESVESDIKMMRRQQRMIKNRESACLSRKRKKEYMTTIEEQLAAMSRENERLQSENSALRRANVQLQDENYRLKKTPSDGPPVKRAAVCVFAVLFLISLNVSPLMSLLSRTPNVTSQMKIHHGRTLLSVQDDTRRHEYNTQEFLATIDRWQRSRRKLQASRGSRDLMLLHEPNIPITMCPTYFNSTESQRLMQELNGWVLGHKLEWKRTRQQEQSNVKVKKARKKQYAVPRKMKEALRTGYRMRESERSQTGTFEMKVYSGADRSYSDILEALRHRNDTFYVVSFRQDHLLIPPTAQNKTHARPRMSLVMPAIGLNDTLRAPAGKVTMMQIDCAVMATQVIHLDKNIVPDGKNDTNMHHHKRRFHEDHN